MSTFVYSKTAADPASFPSLGELRQRLLADETLQPSRRSDMASALASLAKALGRPPELIAADPRVLRPLLARLTPAMVGQRPGRWRNILSLATVALAHAGIIAVQGRIRAAPSEGWLAILQLLASGEQRHFHLWRFARYASQIGIMPGDVDDAVIARYQHDLETRSLVSEPARAARDAARYWNMAAAAHAGWPQRRLTVPDNRNTYAVPWEAFPASLRNEIQAWGERLGASDPFLERDCKPLRPASVASRLRQIRIYLAALVHQDVDPQELDTLAKAVTPARAKLALRFFWERAERQPTHHTYHMAGLALMIARHHARLPAADIDLLCAMADKLRPVAEGLSGRNIALLRQLEDPRKLEALLTLPELLLDNVRRAGPPSIQLARELQTAVAVEILLQVPMRLLNLQTLRVGTHLLRGSHGTMSLSVAGPEIKNGVRIEVPLQQQTARLIGIYLDKYWPLLQAPHGGDWVFPGAKPGQPKSDEGLRSQIRKALADHCGLQFHPHLFRHAAAWLILRENPGAHGLVQRVLGHKSLSSTMAYYSGLEASGAVQHYDRLIGTLRQATLRQGTPPATPRPGTTGRRK